MCIVYYIYNKIEYIEVENIPCKRRTDKHFVAIVLSIVSSYFFLMVLITNVSFLHFECVLSFICFLFQRPWNTKLN